MGEWVLFWHATSDCYFWVENPTDDDYQGDGEVSPVTGIEGHEMRAFEDGVHRPEGWLDPLI
ncbi:hypothetical protein NAV33_07395 [Pseudomonas stutzeri]|uniref:hypothetical protein n=1 Tax=Stutzerimonas stutzeri TaxID=316 RepID=UPI002109C090|nr:hypothetical protein [Stutzerimonas stutzeri]MCQ4311719.1 hypothetical protein [Stutzerimonas stutzeri]